MFFFFYCAKESTVQGFCLTKHPTVKHTMCALCKLISCRAKKTRQAQKIKIKIHTLTAAHNPSWYSPPLVASLLEVPHSQSRVEDLSIKTLL